MEKERTHAVQNDLMRAEKREKERERESERWVEGKRENKEMWNQLYANARLGPMAMAKRRRQRLPNDLENERIN